jgi:hypothetical protein
MCGKAMPRSRSSTGLLRRLASRRNWRALEAKALYRRFSTKPSTPLRRGGSVQHAGAIARLSGTNLERQREGVAKAKAEGKYKGHEAHGENQGRRN